MESTGWESLLIIAFIILVVSGVYLAFTLEGHKGKNFESLEEYYNSVDYSCETHGDCALRDIRKCCGQYLQCVNKDFEARGMWVENFCSENELVSTCETQQINSCSCIDGRCVAG